MLRNPELTALSNQIADQLRAATGQSWAVLPPDYNDSACNLINGELIIDIRPARELHRLSISGSTPRHLWEAHRDAYHVYAPKITVSDQRPAPAIAREIQRRLLPDLIAYIAKLHEVDERTKSAESKKQHAARAILEAINTTPGGRPAEILDGFGSDRLRIHTRQHGGPYYNFEIGYAGSIELKVSLTLEDALKIAPILATGTKDA